MARGRILSRKIAGSRKIAKATRDEEWCYYRIMPFTDDHGRLPGDLFEIKTLCFPAEVITEEEIHSLLVRLHELGLVRFAEGQVIEITAFKNHQKFGHRKADSGLPSYDHASGNDQESSENGVKIEKVENDKKANERSERDAGAKPALDFVLLDSVPLEERESEGEIRKALDDILALFPDSFFPNMSIPELLLNVKNEHGRLALRAVCEAVNRTKPTKRNGAYVAGIIRNMDLAGIAAGRVSEAGDELEWYTRPQCATMAENSTSGKMTDELFTALRDSNGELMKFPDDHKHKGQTVWVKKC